MYVLNNIKTRKIRSDYECVRKSVLSSLHPVKLCMVPSLTPKRGAMFTVL